MSVRFRWPIILGVCSAVLALLMQVPQWIRQADPAYQGVAVRLNSDEGVYLARVEEGLEGRPELSAEAFIGDPILPGGQQALIERVEGMLFAGTGMRAADVLQLMDSVVPPFVFLALWFFFRKCGFSRWQSLLGAGLFCLLELYNLNRPVYQRTSFLLTLLAFLGLMEGTQRRAWAGVLGGAMLGVLLGVYFWAWTFAWLWWGLLMLSELLDPQRKQSRFRPLLFGLAGVIAALPFVAEMMRISGYPAYADAVFRSGLYHSFLPESWGYTAVFTCMAAGAAFIAVRERERMRPYRFAIITVLAGFIALNQQIVHGTVFMFASHYLFALILSAMTALLLGLVLMRQRRLAAIPLLASAVYLAAVGYDGRHIVWHFAVRASDFQEQHFASLMPILDELPRTTILSDPDTELFIAGISRHDVPYALYLKNVLLTHEQLVGRFCLTQLPVPPQERRLSERVEIIWPDANRAFRDPVIRAREVALAEERCALLDKNPAKALQDFNVTHLLWDEKRQPQWKPERLGIPMRSIATGSGWSLWALPQER